jgi:hypothetical protein
MLTFCCVYKIIFTKTSRQLMIDLTDRIVVICLFLTSRLQNLTITSLNMKILNQIIKYLLIV